MKNKKRGVTELEVSLPNQLTFLGSIYYITGYIYHFLCWGVRAWLTSLIEDQVDLPGHRGFKSLPQRTGHIEGL